MSQTLLLHCLARAKVTSDAWLAKKEAEAEEAEAARIKALKAQDRGAHAVARRHVRAVSCCLQDASSDVLADAAIRTPFWVASPCEPASLSAS